MSETPELQAAVERLTFETLLPQIRTRIETLRIAQASAEKTGQKAIAKWYEGQADALERVHGEMEVCHIRAQQELVELRKDTDTLRNWLDSIATYWDGNERSALRSIEEVTARAKAAILRKP